MAELAAVQEKTGNPINQLLARAIEVVSLRRDDPLQRASTLMFDIENYWRKELGIKCVTIGDGENRALVFRNPLERIGNELIDLTGLPHPLSGSTSEPWDMGKFKTTYHDYLFLNRKGFFKLVVVVDQVGEIDSNSPALTVSNHGHLPNTSSDSRDWVGTERQIVQRKAVQTKEALSAILNSEQIPLDPPREARNLPPEKFIRRGNLYGPDTARNSMIWEIANQLRTSSSLPLGKWPKDTEFDMRERLPGFSGRITVVRITEPDFVSRAIEFNVHTTTLSSQPIPEEVIPVPAKDSKKGTTRKDARDGWEERIPAWIKNLYRRENRQFEFPDRLKLTNPSDITLLKYYFAQRVFRIAIYKDNWWLSQPEADVAAHIPGLNLLRLRLESRNRRQEKDLRDIEEQTQKFLEDNYATEPERHHARTIELAVNDLVAKATSNDDLAKVVLTKPVVDAWGDSWVKRLWSI